MITLSPCIRVSGVLYTSPDTGVEYGYVYFRYRFCQNLPLDKQKRLHTFFFTINDSSGAEGQNNEELWFGPMPLLGSG